MRTWVDFAFEVWGTLRLPILSAIGLLLFWALTKIIDRSLRGIISNTFQEYVGAAQGETGSRTLNALGGILFVAIIFYLNALGLANIAIPTTAHPSEYALGVYAFISFSVGSYFVFCVLATRHQP